MSKRSPNGSLREEVERLESLIPVVAGAHFLRCQGNQTSIKNREKIDFKMGPHLKTAENIAKKLPT